MKPFKYKIWDIKNNQWGPYTHFLDDEGELYQDYGRDDIRQLDLNDYEIVYSTGRFDKNKNIIFSGDIIRYENENYIVYFCENYSAFKVKSTKSEFCCYLNMIHFMGREIIGNKYENPSLLEKND